MAEQSHIEITSYIVKLILLIADLFYPHTVNYLLLYTNI